LTKLILEIELVPAYSWFNNVRSAVSRPQWDVIRKQVYSQAYDKCQICGGVGKRHPVECHEIWSYDSLKKLQKLEGMIALCPDCHTVKHMGLAEVQGRGEKALQHFMKVNKLTRKQALTEVEKAFMLWSVMSASEWKVDISHLKNYGIDITKIGERK
jgi:hypothetical protein